MLSCCLFKQTCRDESKSLRDRPWGKQILRDPYKFIVKTHFPTTPLYPPWGKQILRDPYEFTVKPHFPAPPLHPPWGKQILRDPCKFTVKPHFPAPPLHRTMKSTKNTYRYV